jgi:hypothetical protein
MSADTGRVGTCDSCAVNKPLPYEDGEACWICQDCHDAEERAVTAAAMALALALNHATLGINRPGPNTLAITRGVLAAYWEARLAEHNDGPA